MILSSPCYLGPKRDLHCLNPERWIMLKAVIATAMLLMLAGCGGAPRPTAVDPTGYTVISEQPGGTGSLAISIKLNGPPNQSLVKSIAETIINQKKAQFSRVTVNTYAPDSGSSGVAYATSTFDGNTIVHNFNSQAQQQRLASH